MNPNKIKKFPKAPPNIEIEKTDETHLFTTLYGENPTLEQMKEFNNMSKHVRLNQDNDIRSPRRHGNNNPVAPINININNPKVIVPHPKPLKTNSKSNLVKNPKSKLAPEPSPRRHLQRSFDHQKPPPTPSTNPRISNDHLTMFDDASYDDQQFLQNVISMINSNEPVYAKSLFYHQNGQCEWRKCIVVGYKDPRFIIKFDPESSKTKEVPRVALKFDLDDQKRFENRRIEAYSNRIEVDQQLRLETYLYSRANKTKGIKIEPEMLKSIIKRIGQISSQKTNKAKSGTNDNLNKGNLLNNLVQEVHENFLYSDALSQFVLEWNDPKSAEKFTKNGLERYQFEIKPWKNSPGRLEIEKKYSQKVVLPNQIYLQQIVDLCNSFKNNDFLIIMFKHLHPPIQLSYFFEQLKFEVNTAAFDARVNLRIKIIELLTKIIHELKRSISFKIQKMVNLRYKEVLASIINRVFINSFELIKKYKIKFDISVEDDLKTITPSYESIQKFGIESFENILKTFENNETPEIEAFGNDPENLLISFDYLNDNFEIVKSKYLELLDSDIKTFKKTVEIIFDATKDIPKNPEQASIEIFKDDYFKEELTKDDINFDLIREKLNNSKLCYNKFLLTFSEKIETELCSFDIKKFYQSTINNYNQFYSFIFNQLELIADYQTTRIQSNVEFLDNKSGQESNNIEEWHEKHCIILEIKRNIHTIENKLNFVLSIIDFMTDFQYQPQKDYGYVCNVKSQLLNVYLNIKKYNELDRIEKVSFIIVHRKNIEAFKKELEEFQVELMNFHYIESNESNYPNLIQCKNKYDRLIEKMNLYHKRDSILEVPKTEYDIVETLQVEMDDILNVWTIGHKLETDVESWLSIPFRELDIKKITETFVDWRENLELLRNKLEEEKLISLSDDNDDLIIPTIIRYQERIKELIQHLPIVTALCNKHFRGRHWYIINTVTSMHIDVNEGLTWNWLIESGIEDFMLAIQAICRAADSEFQIESALLEMVEELQTMKLKVNEGDGVLRLEDPSYALMMLGKHQQKLQEIFIPPHVHPFLERIREYNVLATNLRQILKQTIEAQEKIDELKPAMDSNDIRTQHEEMAVKFDNQVQKFNEFTGSFKLSLSFHQMVGNERYMEISSDLLSNFNDIRENFGLVLEEKRKSCPRFRLLSDSQLVFLISNCNKPSVTKKVFSLMYPNVKRILLENENYCVGFIAKSGEQITFENKIKVTPEAIEKWHLEFDNEIKETMKKMTQDVISQISTSLEKVLIKFPIQIVCLVYETNFTSNVNKHFHSFESNFLENKQQDFLDFVQNYISLITKDISVISGLYKKTKIKSISSLILTLLNQRDLLEKMIEYKVDSSMNPLWYSSTKFIINNKDDFSISVQIGPISYDYGFEYTGIQRLIVKDSSFNHLFTNFLLSISNSVIPLLCADVEFRKTETVIDFAAVLGYSPFIYPCYSSTTINKLKSAIKSARDCKEFLILEGIDQLMPSTLNELSVWTFCEKNKSPIIATYSILLKDNSNEVPEQLKLYYRPVYLKSIDLEKKYKLILESLLIGDSEEKCQYASSRFAYLTQTVSKVFRPPLSTILMENSIIQFLRNHPSVSIEELVQSFIIHVKSYLVEYDLTEILEYILCLFNRLHINFDPAVDYNMTEGLIKTKSKEIEDENENENEIDQNILYSFKSHNGIIVLGRAMTGKTTLIEKVANKMKKKLLYINPYSISMEDLYGDKSSGLLSSLLIENGTDQWIVFDGSCRADWMELASYVLIHNNKRITFGDGSMLVLASSFRIIFETDDISMASPSILGACTTIYISEDKITLNDHLNKYIEILSNETRIIEPLSTTIFGSTVPASNLINIIRDFFDYFVPKISEFVEDLNCCLSVSKVSLFVLNFFESFHCNLLNYYISENKHSANDLLHDSPNLLLFALFWAFAGSYDNENRIKISDFLIEISQEYIQSINSDLSILTIKEENDSKFYLFDYFYDESNHLWKNWNEKEEILPNLMEVSPYSIFIPTNSLISVYSILKNLIQQQMNVLLFGDDANHITPYVNICLNSDYFLSQMSPILYNSFGKLNVRDILQSFLPDLNVTNGLSVRYPLLTLLGIDISPCNRNSEFLRFVMEHKFFRNCKTFVDESVPSLRQLLTTDKKDLNPRLCHFCFLINIEKENEQILKDAFSSSIEKTWKIDSEFSSFVSNLFIQTLEKVQVEMPHFNFNSIQSIFQRIASTLNKDEQSNLKNIVELIRNEFLFTFYESTRNENILSIINDSNDQLTNHYNESNSGDTITFTPEERINNESQEYSLENDIKLLTKLLKTERNNVVIKSNSKEIPLKIVSSTCSKELFYFHRKELEENLLNSFHDCFVHAGMKKEHSILFIDDTNLQEKELELLNMILKNDNIFGLFPKGEKMKLMSELHSKDSNSFDDGTIESSKNFNFLLSEFLCNSRKYCHIVIATHFQNENSFKNVSVLFSLTETISDKRLLHLRDVLQTNLPHLFNNYPYLLSDTNLNFILSKVDEKEAQIKKKVEQINERFSILKESKEINDSFLNEYFVKMQNTEIDINQLNEELKVSMENLQHLQEISEQQATLFEKEAEELKIEESKAQILRKECEQQLAETKAILENASHEVKHLSVRDTAVIKGMNHPPKGVVLVVIAMCIIIDIDIDYNQKDDDLTSAWTKGKIVMNDPSFINKLINSALDLSPLIIQKLEPIINDSNFEPSIIEKSSSAAKSICIFIRSLPHYYEALKIYKEKNTMMTEMEEKLSVLFEKQNEAMTKLTLSKNRCIENQTKIEKITQTKKSYEDQLTNQREKIGFYRKFQETIEHYTNEQFEFFSEKTKKYNEINDFLFIKQVFKDLSGPFTDSQRNELLQCLKDCLNQSTETRESLLFCNNSVVKKWHKLQYPISQFWKENTSCLAPEGGRWVIAEGLRCCSISYLKMLLNSTDLPTLSCFSASFEKDFIELIQKSNRIIVTDYDFNCPSPIISLTNKSLENKENTLVYHGEEITFQKDLIVYFDVDSLPSVSYIDFNATLVNLRVGFAICTEQIALSMFRVKSHYSDIQRNETSIFSIKDQINEIEKEIELLLTENRIEIFDSKEMQKQFIEQSREREKIIKELNEMKEIHMTLFESFCDILNMASEICQCFEKFPIQTSVWRMYENYFQNIPSASVDTIKTHLANVILASLPSKLRMNTILNEYSIVPENFDKDIEKVASVLGNYEMFKLQNPSNIIKETAPNRPVFVVSPSSQFEICSLVDFLKNNNEINCNVFNYSDDLSKVVRNSISNGSIVSILINSIDDLKGSISAVSIVLSQSVFNPSFRLFLIVTFPLHHENDIISRKVFLPSIVTFCDTIYFTQPFNSYSISTQLNPSNRVNSKLVAFHSLSSIIRKFKLCGKVYDFGSFALAKKCLSVFEDDENESEIVDGIELFISLFVYGDGRLTAFQNQNKEERLASYTKYLSNLWNRKIEIKCSLDSPESFGFGKNDFDFFKVKLYSFKGGRKRVEQVESEKGQDENDEADKTAEINDESQANEENNETDERKDADESSETVENKEEKENGVDESIETNDENDQTEDSVADSKNENKDDEESTNLPENDEIQNESKEQEEEENSLTNQENENTENESNSETENKQEEQESFLTNQGIKHIDTESNTENENNNEDEENSSTVQENENAETECNTENENKNEDEENSSAIQENEAETNEQSTENSPSTDQDDTNKDNDSNDDSDGVRNSYESLLSVDLSVVTEIPRTLSREFDFAQENLRRISEGKSEFTPRFQHQLLQLIKVPDIYDMSLFVYPGDFFEIVKAEFLKNNGIYSKSILMIEDPDKYYEELQPRGVLCKGVVAINAMFANGEFCKFDGFTYLNEFWLRPISYDPDANNQKEKLNIVNFYKDGEIVDSLYIRFNGDSNELEKVVLMNNL